MKNVFYKLNFRQLIPLLVVVLGSLLIPSCKDDFYEQNRPSWLGDNIYDQLKAGYKDDSGVMHTFANFTKLIDDVGYTEVLKKTGSKTLFVADDEAFNRYFQNNSWGVTRYEDLSLAKKTFILNSSMINNALLIENLSTIEGPVKGQALRRVTAAPVMISSERGSDLPKNAYWDRFRTTGMFLEKDNTPIPMLHFLEAQMRAHNVTDKDFSIIFNGKTREKDDAYIFNDKVKYRDITCQNGYIHILEDVLIPPSNMAEVMRNAPETQIFSSYMERYAAPYFSGTILGGTDSVFVKGYFSENSGTVPYDINTKRYLDPNKNPVSSLLTFDPGWNQYGSQTDMGVIFAPSDAALNTYFEQGAGRVLKARYGSVENIPNDVLVELIRNHMKPSFMASLPSLFPTIVDDAQERMGIDTTQIEKAYLASNGVIYVTNTVYPPALYSSVMYPAKINENMKVFYWAIDKLEFKAYLLSMVNTYSFILPTDNFTYIVPSSLKHDDPKAWKLHYDDVKQVVYASVHPYNVKTHIIGDSVSIVRFNPNDENDPLKMHLEDMLDYHIIVGKIEGDKAFYRTKGGGTIRIAQNGGQISFAGGGDIERNVSVPVTKIYDMSKETNGRGNGMTYAVDQPVQTATKSVYSILSDSANYPQFNEFFKLLQGADDLWVGDDSSARKFSIFYQDKSFAGLDYNVRFLNTYHYTLYVPVNNEVKNAIAHGLPTWDDVAAITDDSIRKVKANKIIRFLRYHFQDNSVFLDNPTISGSYQTATLNNNTETFYKLALSGDNNSLNITDGSGEPAASVVKTSGMYNIMARDFKFNSGNPKTAQRIETSSYVVIHQINRCLYFEGEYGDLQGLNKVAKKSSKY